MNYIPIVDARVLERPGMTMLIPAGPESRGGYPPARYDISHTGGDNGLFEYLPPPPGVAA